MPILDLVGVYCPMGCGPTLHRMTSGLIQCLDPMCPDSAAAWKILGDQQTDDIVDFTETGFTLTHPLRDRLRPGGLVSCPVHALCEQLPGPPNGKPGRYRARITDYGMDLEEIAPVNPA